MSILEEEKLNQLTEKLTELDFRDSNVAEKVTEIINDVLKDNADKIGTVTETTTIDEALAEEKEGFEELKKLQEEGILEYVKNEDLKNKLNANASEGIKDEEAEKLSLEEAGYVTEALKDVKPEDILEEVFKKLEEVIEEKKKAIDKKIEENEAMRSKVEEREKLKVARTKVNNLYQKTQNYKGTEGKNLNQNVRAAVTDLDIQLAKLTRETSRDGVEITDSVLDEENKKFEEEKKGLDDLLSKIRESYEKEDTEKLRLTIIERQIDDIADGFTTNMKVEDLYSKVDDLYSIYDKNRNVLGIKQLFEHKTIKIIKQDDRGIEKEVELTVGTIFNATVGGKMDDARANYIKATSKAQQTEDDKHEIEECKTKYKKYKEVFETFCGNNVKVQPLMTEQEYIAEFKHMGEYAGKVGLFGFGKNANIIAQKMQKMYVVLEGVISKINSNGIISAYRDVAEKLRNNEAVKDENLPPRTLINEERPRIDVEKVETPVPLQQGANVDMSRIEEGLNQFANEVKNEQGETSTYNYGYTDSNDGSR